MIETAANLMWGAMAIASAAILVLGAGMCAFHSFFPADHRSGFARRVLRAVSSALREASLLCEHIAYRHF